jgi:integrase/recombinase XerD
MHIINQLNECEMNVKTSFLAITSRKKLNGEVPIYCYLSSGTQNSRFSTNLSTKPEAWDSKKQRAKGKTVEAVLFNKHLEKIKEQINKIVYEVIKTNDEITLQDVKNQMTGNSNSKPTTLMTVYKIRFEKMKPLVGKDYQKTTLIKFTYLANAVQDFLKTELKVTDTPLKKLNRVFIDDLELYLRVQKSMKTISINKIIQMLKSIVKYSLERGWIERDPFIGHKSKSVQTEILFLTHEQIIKLETTIFSQERLNRVKELFLFSIYTGLHYADAMSLTISNLVNGVDGNLWIDYVRGKTGKRIQIPLLNKAQALLVKFEKQGLKNDYILPRITNQKVNSYLKEIGDVLGIEIPLTHKIARKTFGSILLYHDIPIKVVSELMGHSSTLITERHYAKLDIRKLGEAINQMQKCLN